MYAAHTHPRRQTARHTSTARTHTHAGAHGATRAATHALESDQACRSRMRGALAAIAFGTLLVSAGFGCAEDGARPPHDASIGTSSQSMAQPSPPPGVPPAAGTTPSTRNEQEWEIGSARTIDYVSLQQSLARSLQAEVSPEIGHFRTIARAQNTVTSEDAFVAALSKAVAGDTVFVPGDAMLDLTSHAPIVVPAGVLVASSRRVGGSQGAILYVEQLDATLFHARAGAQFVGLSVMGPDTDRRTVQLEKLKTRGGTTFYYAVPVSRGILVEGSGVVVENCEIWGWSRSGVEVVNGAANVRVRHNLIYLNQRHDLGYGVYVDQADVLVECNLFDWCRHCVAGSGRPGTSYEARYNFVLPNANGHSFDMHGGVDRRDGTNIAGTNIVIHHNNVSQSLFPGVVIRGEPQGRLEIFQNTFQEADAARAIAVAAQPPQTRISDNVYGAALTRQ